VIEALFVVALLAAVVPALPLVPGSGMAGTALLAAAGAAALLGIAVALGPGPAAGVLALPWLVVTITLAISRLSGMWARRGSLRAFADGLGADAACAFLAVGATWALLSRLGLRPMGFEDRIVLLTAVHFHVAGFVLVLVGELLRRRAASGVVAAGLTALVTGIPTTALGFLGVEGAALVGAWLVAVGGIVIGTGHLRAGLRGPAAGLRGPLPAVAGVALLLSMPLAVVWATASWLGVALLSVPVMAATHGALNVVGFAVPAVFAWRKATAA
jgi:hypothetical protein